MRFAVCSSVLFLTVSLSHECFGQSVGRQLTFHVLPDGETTPLDNEELDLNDAYQLDNGVTLRFVFRDENTGLFNANGRFEARGDDSGRGFESSRGTEDDDTGLDAALNEQLGPFFLRSPVSQGQAGDVGLRIIYGNNAGMRFAAGEIWDLDAAEQWRITAHNAAGATIATLDSPAGIGFRNAGSLDSMPWRFEVFAQQDIASVLIDFTGTKTNLVGLAFDNFTTRIDLPADFDNDGDVDGQDMIQWRPAYRNTTVGDADGDLDSDGADFMMWQRQLGARVTATAAGAQVPEPAAWALTGSCAVLAGCVRRYRTHPTNSQVSLD